MTLKRFIEIWKFELNKETFRYENLYWSLDYLFVKYHEKNKDLKEISFMLSDMQKPSLKDMD